MRRKGVETCEKEINNFNMTKQKNEEENQKNFFKFLKYIVLISIVVSGGFTFLLNKLGISQTFSKSYFLTFIVIAFIVSFFYINRVKERIAKDSRIAYVYILIMLQIAVIALISSPLFFWKQINVIYGFDFFLLGSFCLILAYIFNKKIDKLEKQGGMVLYKTKLGMKIIDTFSKRFAKILKPIQYVIVVVGYFLMAAVLWLLVEQTYIYFKLFDAFSEVVSGPPVMLLLPYAPDLFGYSTVLPPLYFTTFIIAFLIAVVPHEFSHGIFARLNKIKIKSTGFAFLGPILGAFVEQDEKQMEKAKKFPQLSILAAGTFANLIVGIIFALVMWLFFVSAFAPAGMKFNTYALSQINLDDATSVESVSNGLFLTKIIYNNETYYSSLDLGEISDKNGLAIVYDDSPALRAGIPIGSAITEFDGVKITSYEELAGAIKSHSPGDEVKIVTVKQTGIRDVTPEKVEHIVELDEREGDAFLGIGIIPLDDSAGSLKYVMPFVSKVKDPFIFYESTIGEIGWFVYFVLWWIVFISIAISLFNMLPLGILDGGRFFYLTIWGITGREVWGKRAYKFITWFIIAILLLMMSRWVVGFF